MTSALALGGLQGLPVLSGISTLPSKEATLTLFRTIFFLKVLKNVGWVWHLFLLRWAIVLMHRDWIIRSNSPSMS
jgi:hypothetical protein